MTTTTPHITLTQFDTTPQADCALCGAHTSGSGIHAHDVVQAWVDDHATDCTPTAVRTKAAHLRDAAELLDVHADADPDDGTDWDHPAIQAAVKNLRLHLQDTANRLETAGETATEGTAR